MKWWVIWLAIPVAVLRGLEAPWWAVFAALYIEAAVGLWVHHIFKAHAAGWEAVDRELAEIRKLLPKPKPIREYYED